MLATVSNHLNKNRPMYRVLTNVYTLNFFGHYSCLDMRWILELSANKKCVFILFTKIITTLKRTGSGYIKIYSSLISTWCTVFENIKVFSNSINRGTMVYFFSKSIVVSHQRAYLVIGPKMLRFHNRQFKSQLVIIIVLSISKTKQFRENIFSNVNVYKDVPFGKDKKNSILLSHLQRDVKPILSFFSGQCIVWRWKNNSLLCTLICFPENVILL